jgi:hypothetical protein
MAPLTQPPDFANYLDLDDLKAWMNMSAITGRDAELTMLMDMASEGIQEYLQQPIAPTQITELIDGSAAGGVNQSMITLKYYPLIVVSSVIEGRGTSGLFTLAEQTPTVTPQDAYQVDYDHGRLVRIFGASTPRPWFPGSRNVEVVYRAGFQKVPNTIKLATLQYAKHLWQRWQNPRQGKPGTSSNDDNAPDVMSGIPNDISAELARYKNVVIA